MNFEHASFPLSIKCNIFLLADGWWEQELLRITQHLIHLASRRQKFIYVSVIRAECCRFHTSLPWTVFPDSANSSFSKANRYLSNSDLLHLLWALQQRQYEMCDYITTPARTLARHGDTHLIETVHRRLPIVSTMLCHWEAPNCETVPQSTLEKGICVTV